MDGLIDELGRGGLIDGWSCEWIGIDGWIIGWMNACEWISESVDGWM